MKMYRGKTKYKGKETIKINKYLRTNFCNYRFATTDQDAASSRTTQHSCLPSLVS